MTNAAPPSRSPASDTAAPGHRASYIAVLLASTFLMGSSFVAGKILLAAGYPPLLLAGWRFLVAALATVPFVLREGRLREGVRPAGTGRADFAAVLLIGFLQTTAVMGLLFMAMRTTSASTAAILLFTNPIWVAVLGHFFLGEALSLARATGLLIGISGVAFAIGAGGVPSGGSAILGETLALLSSLCWAAATVVNKRANLKVGPWALSFWQMLFGSLLLLTFAYASRERWPATSTGHWIWFFWLAIPASTGSFGLWFLALRMGGATRTSGFLFMTPLFTAILAFLVLGAPLSWFQALGGSMIGVALWLVNREAPSRTAEEARAAARSLGEP